MDLMANLEIIYGQPDVNMQALNQAVFSVS